MTGRPGAPTPGDLCFIKNMEEENLYKLSEIGKRLLYYGRYERSRPYATQTLAGYEAVLKRMVKWIGDKDIREIKIEDLMKVKKILIDRGCKEGYIYKQLTVMRTLFRFCKSGLKIENVLDSELIEIPARKQNTVEYLTPDEVQKFIAAIDHSTIYGVRQKALVTTLLDTGMRISEALSLNRNSINFENKTAVIIGKGAKQRLVFFRQWSLWWIKKYLSLREDDHEALFVTHCKKPYIPTRFVPEDARRFFRIHAKRAGMRLVAPHMLRRTAATTFRFNGGDTRDIQLFLGHSSVSITERYLGVDYGKIQKAHEKFLNYGGIEKFGDDKINIQIKWARDAGYLKCRVCGTTKRRHAGHGYCDICYIRALRQGKLKKKPMKKDEPTKKEEHIEIPKAIAAVGTST